MSQADLAAKTKPAMSVATINRLEQGKQKPRWVTIRTLADALGVKPEEIEFGEQKPVLQEPKEKVQPAQVVSSPAPPAHLKPEENAIYDKWLKEMDERDQQVKASGVKRATPEEAKKFWEEQARKEEEEERQKQAKKADRKTK